MTQIQTMKQIITNILDQHAAYKTWEEVADMIVRELRIKEDSDFSTQSLQARIAELEAQQAVLVESLKQLASDKWNNQHWARGIAFEALAAVKPAGQEGCDRV